MENVFEVNDATFEAAVMYSEKPVLVDFWAAWCGPCRAVSPIVEELAITHDGTLKVLKMDVDQNGHTVSQLGIRSIPTLLIFKGGKIVDQIVGFVPKEVIDQRIRRVLA